MLMGWRLSRAAGHGRLQVNEHRVSLLIGLLAVSLSQNAVQSFLLALTFASLQVIGQSIFGLLSGSLGSTLSRISAILIGIVLVVELQQLLLRVFVWRMSLEVLLLASLTMVLSTRHRPSRSSTLMPPRRDACRGGITLAAASALLYATRVHFWTLPLSASAACLLSLLPSRGKRRALWTSTILGAMLLAAIGNLLRPQSWPLIQQEQVFYNLVARSLATVSAPESTFSSVTPFYYHWLGLGLTGWLDTELYFAPFHLMSGILPIVFIALLLAIIFSWVRLESLTSMEVSVFVLVLGTFAFRMAPGLGLSIFSNLQTPGPVLSLCFSSCLFLLVNNLPILTSRRVMAALFILAYGATGSYTTAAIGPLLGIGTFLIVRAIREQELSQQRRWMIALAAVTCGSGLALWRFTGFPAVETYGGARISLTPLFGFVEQLNGEIRDLSGHRDFAAKTGYFLSLSAVLSLAILQPQANHRTPTRFICSACLTGLALSQTSDFGDNVWIAVSGYCVAVPSILMVLFITRRTDPSYVYLGSATGLALGVAWILVGDTPFSVVRDHSLTFRTFSPSFSLGIGLALALTGIYLRFSQTMRRGFDARHRVTYQQSWALAASAVLMFQSLQGAVVVAEAYGIYGETYERRGFEYSASPDTENTARWLSVIKRPTTLLAFDLASADLQQQHLLAISGARAALISWKLWGRSLIEDPRSQRIMQLQRQLSAPDLPLVTSLLDEGITHVALRRPITRERFQTLFGAPDFETQEWSVYELASIQDSTTSDP